MGDFLPGLVIPPGTGSVMSVGGSSPINSTGGPNPVISITNATPAAAGAMSAADKTKLDGLNPNPVTDVIGVAPITSSGGPTPSISILSATQTDSGSMSASDKAKLDGIESGAQVSRLRQTVFANLATDQTMNSTSYQPLNFSASITTTTGGKVALDFTCSAESDAALGTPISFEVRMDGVRLGCCAGFYGVGARQSAALTFVTGTLPPGVHVFDVRWKRGAGAGNCNVRPVTQGDWEQASMRLMEVGA